MQAIPVTAYALTGHTYISHLSEATTTTTTPSIFGLGQTQKRDSWHHPSTWFFGAHHRTRGSPSCGSRNGNINSFHDALTSMASASEHWSEDPPQYSDSSKDLAPCELRGKRVTASQS
eukprot:2933720-Amphidinium_carterae.1